jgi:hypothetical protein
MGLQWKELTPHHWSSSGGDIKLVDGKYWFYRPDGSESGPF